MNQESELTDSKLILGGTRGMFSTMELVPAERGELIDRKSQSLIKSLRKTLRKKLKSNLKGGQKHYHSPQSLA